MFVGRKSELSQLRHCLDLKRSKVIVVYGRRRVGKTELIRQACGQSALFFEGLENQSKSQQIENFLFQLKLQTGKDYSDERPRNWREAFVLLLNAVGKKGKYTTIVLDEFQWMANYRSEIVSDLKMVWDQYLSRAGNLSLILCGSIASFMMERFVKSGAFYGRTDLIIHLKSFCLTETAEMLGKKGTEEILDAQMLVGGVPRYLELLRPETSLRLGLDKLAFSPNGYFLGEYDRIFTSHFGRNPDYLRIVETLASHLYGLKRKELAERARVDPGGSLSEHLQNLEAGGFLSSANPFHVGHQSRLIKYYLIDPYLRFYFAFIRPNLKKVQTGATSDIFSRLCQTGKFHSWMGRSFEYVCADHAGRIAELLGFSGIDFTYGPFFDRSERAPGVQIDLAFDRADHVITLCEMKFSRSPVSVSIIEEMERKVAALQGRFPNRTIQKVLVVRGRAGRQLTARGYFYRIIQAEELF
ncbi:MAG: ATP-binding protein [Planctomycetota bacterium]|nr:ATP-binding protein [Planctomycetota bacterium]